MVLDVLNDLQGRYVTTLVKRKLSMRAGETDRAVTVHDHNSKHLASVWRSPRPCRQSRLRCDRGT